jgi:CPA2 family monovalent cation:H+ antiporter-2
VGQLSRWKLLRDVPAAAVAAEQSLEDHVVIVGFGPAGQAAAHAVLDGGGPVVVVDLNPRSVRIARQMGIDAHVGDASSPELLEHLDITTAAVVVITLPDPAASRAVIQQARGLGARARIICRSRYHVHRWELELAGAHVVIDEEQEMGAQLAAALREYVGDGEPETRPQAAEALTDPDEEPTGAATGTEEETPASKDHPGAGAGDAAAYVSGETDDAGHDGADRPPGGGSSPASPADRTP